MEGSTTALIPYVVAMVAVVCAVFCGRIAMIGIRKRMYGKAAMIGGLAFAFLVYGFTRVI